MPLRDRNLLDVTDRQLLMRCQVSASVNRVAHEAGPDRRRLEQAHAKLDLDALYFTAFIPRRPAACKRKEFRLVMNASQLCWRMGKLPLVELRLCALIRMSA
jgi:hypothetical protein